MPPLPRDHPEAAVGAPTPSLPPAVVEVVDVVSAAAGVEAVVLGGSRATGTAHAGSDWDLGVCYRGSVDVEALRELGEVHPPGSWGRLMNGGAWLQRGEQRVDVLLRDLDAVEHWTREARQGRFEIDLLLGYLAGMPTYTLTAEVASSVVLVGRLEISGSYPEALAAEGPGRWRFHRDFSLTYARRLAQLGDRLGALGQLARAAVEEAHARHCEERRWVLNEKRTLSGLDLDSAIDALGEGAGVVAVVAEVSARLQDRPGRTPQTLTPIA